MKQEEFKLLYDKIAEAYPEECFEFNGADIISTEIRRGIWVNIQNDINEDGKDSWCAYWELKNASCKLWERHIADLQGKMLNVMDYVKDILNK